MRFLRFAIAAILIVGTLIAAPFVWWFLDRDSPIRFISATAIPESGFPGARVQTTYKVEVTRDSHSCNPGLKCPQAECSVEGQRSWIDSAGRGWPSTTAHLGYNKGENDINLDMVIPGNASYGAADIDNAILWSCDPLRLFHHIEPMTPLTVVVQQPPG